jgi:hypothetical protein
LTCDRDTESHKTAIAEGRVSAVYGTGAHRLKNGKFYPKKEMEDWFELTQISFHRVYNFSGEWHYVFQDRIDKALFEMAFNGW